jgi:urea transport system substrate-binding protein
MRSNRAVNVAALVGAVLVAAYLVRLVLATEPPIRIGVLHSLSGTMAISEKSLVDAVQLAVEEVNRAGGVLGRQLEAIVADGKSEPDVFAREAERLIREERTAAIFGCWTSGSRRTVKPVIEKYQHLLLYPLQYEGLEDSPNIIYLGAAPNQQIIPALKWVLGNIGKRVFLVGSDYIFPRAANAIIRDQLAKWHGDVVGEEYLMLGDQQVTRVIQAIQSTRPDVILNTLNGDSNVAFFTSLRAAGITSQEIPTLSFSIAEEEMNSLPRQAMAGDYAAWTYFQSVESPMNERFVQAFKRKYGDQRVTDDPIEASYVAVKLWAQAVEAAGTPDAAAVRRTIVDRSLQGPGGMVFVDGQNRHAWKTVRIGRVRADGQFDVVWASDRPIRPVPYPAGRTRDEWDSFLGRLYKQWGSRWVNPGPVLAQK